MPLSAIFMFSTMAYATRPRNSASGRAISEYMHCFLFKILTFFSRFVERHENELEVFYSMKDNIINFDHFFQKLKDNRELTENIAKIVSRILSHIVKSNLFVDERCYWDSTRK